MRWLHSRLLAAHLASQLSLSPEAGSPAGRRVATHALPGFFFSLKGERILDFSQDVGRGRLFEGEAGCAAGLERF